MIYIDSVCAVLCVDINECERDDDNCHENAQCINTEGSFTCFCNPGYTGDGVTCTSKWQLLFIVFVYLMNCLIQPVDVNECELGTHICNSSANCTDTDGSFNCTCREGFEGDGFNCTGKFYYFRVNSISVLT